MKLLGRILLAFSAIVLAVGAWIHTAGFDRMSTGVAKSDLSPFLGRGFKVLWLQDSTIAIVLAIVPVITAALTYYFIGNFFGGHIFLVAGVAAILGRLLYPAAKRL